MRGASSLAVRVPVAGGCGAKVRTTLTVNGGYFWRLDVKTFFDGVCLGMCAPALACGTPERCDSSGKNRSDAMEPPSFSEPNYGVGDCSVVADGVALASNCDCPGFSRPVVMTINGTASRLDILTRGALPPAGLALDSTSAGQITRSRCVCAGPSLTARCCALQGLILCPQTRLASASAAARACCGSCDARAYGVRRTIH